MTGNPDNLRQKLTIFLDSNQIVAANTNFIVCTPPFIGGESKLANLLDFLYSHSDHVLNLSKKEYLSLGTSFYDLKLLLQVLNPQKIIALQNSYRHSRLISYLPDRVTALENGYALEFPTKQLFRLRTKKTLISLEELLVRQRQSLQRTGMLVILLVIG
jgi:mRNA degradation ribonuclease J1/J2